MRKARWALMEDTPVTLFAGKTQELKVTFCHKCNSLNCHEGSIACKALDRLPAKKKQDAIAGLERKRKREEEQARNVAAWQALDNLMNAPPPANPQPSVRTQGSK